MIKIKLAKYGTVLGLFGTVFHYSSHGYLRLEQMALDKFTATRAAVVAGLAEDFGYEKPKPTISEFDALELVEREALSRGVNPALARALMKAESSGNQYAVSRAGAIGYMQIMPFNAKRCGLSHYGELFDDAKNIKCGIQILDEELKANKGNVVHAVQSYNGGSKCVNRCEESINHARVVLAFMARDIR